MCFRTYYYLFRNTDKIRNSSSTIFSYSKMRRGKRKQAIPKKIENEDCSIKIKSENILNYCDGNIKQEPVTAEEQDNTKVDLNKFKFQKKPTVKIEFECDEISSTKVVIMF